MDREQRLQKLIKGGINSEIAMAYCNCRDAAAVERIAAKITQNIVDYGELPLDKATIVAADAVKKILF